MKQLAGLLQHAAGRHGSRPARSPVWLPGQGAVPYTGCFPAATESFILHGCVDCHVLSNMVLTVDTPADRNAELMEIIDMKKMNETIFNVCCGLKIL